MNDIRFQYTSAAPAPTVDLRDIHRALAQHAHLHGAFIQLLDARLNDARERYEGSTASELNRGAILELRSLLSFLRTGDFAP